MLKISATKSRAISIEVSTALSQIKECLNQPWHLDQEIVSIGFVSSFLWLWCIMSGLILGSAHAVKIIPQSLVPLFSACLCQDHLVLTFPHFSWTCPEWQMGAKLVKDWKYMHMPLKLLASLGCLDPVPCCPNPVSYTCNLHQPLPGCTLWSGEWLLPEVTVSSSALSALGQISLCPLCRWWKA